MNNWHDEFHKILKNLEKKAGRRGNDNPEAYVAFNEMLIWVLDDHDLVQLCDDDEAYEAREYKVVMSSIEAEGLCEQPYFKEVYEI